MTELTDIINNANNYLTYNHRKLSESKLISYIDEVVEKFKNYLSSDVSFPTHKELLSADTFTGMLGRVEKNYPGKSKDFQKIKEDYATALYSWFNLTKEKGVAEALENPETYNIESNFHYFITVLTNADTFTGRIKRIKECIEYFNDKFPRKHKRDSVSIGFLKNKGFPEIGVSAHFIFGETTNGMTNLYDGSGGLNRYAILSLDNNNVALDKNTAVSIRDIHGRKINPIRHNIPV